MKAVNKIRSNSSGGALVFRGCERSEPQLLRILLDSGFWTKCGAPHFVHLLLKPLIAVDPNHRILLLRLSFGCSNIGLALWQSRGHDHGDFRHLGIERFFVEA